MLQPACIGLRSFKAWVCICLDALLHSFSGPWGVLLLGALMFAERFVIILPSYAVLALGGAAAAMGLMNPWAALLATMVGSMLAAWSWHVLGWRIGGPRCRDFVCRHGKWMGLNPKRYDELCAALDRNARWTLLLAQIIPTVRILATLPAGVARIRWGRIAVPVLLGSLAWNGFFFADGYLLGINNLAGPWELIAVAIGVLVFELVLLALGWWLGKRRALRRQAQAQQVAAEPELPA